MTTVLLLVVLGLTPPQETAQERPKVPKDSIELLITGCLKGRLLQVSEVRQTDTQSGPVIQARSFRLTAKGDVMDQVKHENHHLVEVTGVIKRSALYEPGIKVGKGIVITGGQPVAGAGRAPVPSEFVPVLDVSTLRSRATSCGSF
jgi:hypothetical protein